MPALHRDTSTPEAFVAPSAEATAEATSQRSTVAAARRVVVKLGTQVVVDDDGSLATARLEALVDAVARAIADGRQVILVSSGAVGLGRTLLGHDRDNLTVDKVGGGKAGSKALSKPLDTVAERRACAAVGQSHLLAAYQRAFARHGLLAAQVLVTEQDFDHRQRYLALRATLEQLLDNGAVPILNENDAVAHAGTVARCAPGQGVFADNDRMAALVAAKGDADLLVLLTDVDGVFDRDPRRHPDAVVLPRVDEDLSVLDDIDDDPGSGRGRGGMKAKVDAARAATFGGCQTVIASGRRAEVLDRVLAGEEIGTWFPVLSSLSARRRWIAFAAAVKGVLHLDAGAVDALCERQASLLAVGLRAIDGDFERGDVVELRGPEGQIIARGRMSWSAAEARRWWQHDQAPESLDGHKPNCLLRRTHIVMLQS